MKILIDMNLTPLWREPLQVAGHQVVHWSEVGDRSASDIVLLEWARLNDFVVFTHDLDFGMLLYATGAESPSVIQVRNDDVDPSVLVTSVLAALEQTSSEIADGALVTIYLNRHRISVLPLKH